MSTIYTGDNLWTPKVEPLGQKINLSKKEEKEVFARIKGFILRHKDNANYPKTLEEFLKQFKLGPKKGLSEFINKFGKVLGRKGIDQIWHDINNSQTKINEPAFSFEDVPKGPPKPWYRSKAKQEALSLESVKKEKGLAQEQLLKKEDPNLYQKLLNTFPEKELIKFFSKNYWDKGLLYIDQAKALEGRLASLPIEVYSQYTKDSWVDLLENYDQDKLFGEIVSNKMNPGAKGTDHFSVKDKAGNEVQLKSYAGKYFNDPEHRKIIDEKMELLNEENRENGYYLFAEILKLTEQEILLRLGDYTGQGLDLSEISNNREKLTDTIMDVFKTIDPNMYIKKIEQLREEENDDEVAVQKDVDINMKKALEPSITEYLVENNGAEKLLKDVILGKDLQKTLAKSNKILRNIEQSGANDLKAVAKKELGNLKEKYDQLISAASDHAKAQGTQEKKRCAKSLEKAKLEFSLAIASLEKEEKKIKAMLDEIKGKNKEEQEKKLTNKYVDVVQEKVSKKRAVVDQGIFSKEQMNYEKDEEDAVKFITGNGLEKHLNADNLAWFQDMVTAVKTRKEKEFDLSKILERGNISVKPIDHKELIVQEKIRELGLRIIKTSSKEDDLKAKDKEEEKIVETNETRKKEFNEELSKFQKIKKELIKELEKKIINAQDINISSETIRKILQKGFSGNEDPAVLKMIERLDDLNS